MVLTERQVTNPAALRRIIDAAAMNSGPLFNTATQYGADAWDAEHARLRPDVLERIRQERDCAQYRRIVEELRRANEKARTNGNAR